MSRRFDSLRFLIRRMLKSNELRSRAILGVFLIFVFICGLFFMLNDPQPGTSKRDYNENENSGTFQRHPRPAHVELNGDAGERDVILNEDNASDSDDDQEENIKVEDEEDPEANFVAKDKDEDDPKKSLVAIKDEDEDDAEKIFVGIKGHQLPFKQLSLEPRLTPCTDRRVDLLIIVFTRPENSHQRKAIRKTWGGGNSGSVEQNKNITKCITVFVVGKSFSQHDATIERESVKHGDILQGGFEEIGQHSSQKVILALTWISGLHDLCRPKLVLKTSDNIFLNIPLIMQWIEKNIKQAYDVYLGKLLRRDTPNRNRNHPHHVPEFIYPKTHFPDLIQGPLYLFSYDVVLKLLAVMPKVNRLPLEDAYVGMLAAKAGAFPRHDDRFNLVKLTTNDCVNIKRLFVYDVMANDHVVLNKQIKHKDILRHCQGIKERRIGDL